MAWTNNDHPWSPPTRGVDPAGQCIVAIVIQQSSQSSSTTYNRRNRMFDHCWTFHSLRYFISTPSIKKRTDMNHDECKAEIQFVKEDQTKVRTAKKYVKDENTWKCTSVFLKESTKIEKSCTSSISQLAKNSDKVLLKIASSLSAIITFYLWFSI